MLERVRDALYKAMTAPQGDNLAAVRIPKELARRLNATLGRPFAPIAELQKRERAREHLATLRTAAATGATCAKRAKESAPIVVYFEKDSNVRELTRIEDLLSAKSYKWKRLDIAGDEATLDFVMREAKCERDDLPIVFVASKVIGPLESLVRADVSGELARAVNG
jgi:hypothetical protein